MPKTQTLEEVIEHLAKAQADLTAAQARHAAARGDYVADLAADNAISQARSRKASQEAAAKLEHAEERVAALEALLERVKLRDADRELARRLENSAALGAVAITESEKLQRCLQATVDQERRTREAVAKFRESLPVQPSSSESMSSLLVPEVLSRHAAATLYGLSGGRFPSRGVASSPGEIAGGPTLHARVRETVIHALSYQPEPERPITEASPAEVAG